VKVGDQGACVRNPRFELEFLTKVRFTLNLFILISLNYLEIKVFIRSAYRWYVAAKDNLKCLNYVLAYVYSWVKYLRSLNKSL
jgi:uncharacterized membrane protein YqjE